MGKQKVITIKGDKTKWYDKVIFVVKSEEFNNNIDLLLEAEKIVSEYMLSNQIANTNKNILENKVKIKKGKNYIDIFLYSSICIAICMLLYLAII